MEIPAIDLARLPTKFRKMAVTAYTILQSCSLLYRSIQKESLIPLSIKVDYTNLFNMHFGMLRTSNEIKNSEEFKSTLGRFDIFNSKEFRTIASHVSLTTMTELGQLVAICISSTSALMSADKRFRHIDHSLFKDKEEREKQFTLNTLKCYKMAIAYEIYRDDSLMGQVEPYIIRLGFEPIYSRITVPLRISNTPIWLSIEENFKTVMREIIRGERRIDRLKRFTDSDNPEYSRLFTSTYIDVAKSYINYPQILIKTEDGKI